jgi:hypothetical protein
MIEQSIVILGGLGDRIQNIKLATGFWSKYGFKSHVLDERWKDKENFRDKFNRLKREVNKIKPDAIIGTSAGGSVGFNLFLDLWPQINKTINICGRLKVGDVDNFNLRTKNYPVFAESVIICETRISKLTKAQKARMLCIQSGIWDELVPANTSHIDGVKLIELPVPEHVLCITSALTVFAKRDIFSFLME